MADNHLMHGGPFAGERLDSSQLPRHAFDHGFWPLDYVRIYRRFVGRYVRDQGSAGGRDWDWRDD